VTFINMGGSYPDNAFTGVIFSESAAAVGNVDGLAGKTVDLTGEIKLHRGKPEIVVRPSSQIKVR